MSAKPVAWKVYGHRGEFVTLRSEEAYGYTELMGRARKEGHETVTPLYAESPAQARALAIQEAARECERMTERWARRHSPGAMGQMCGLGEGTASECVDAIRALSPAPSVTEEWVEKIAMGFGGTNRATRTQAVYATLAALGVEVKS